MPLQNYILPQWQEQTQWLTAQCKQEHPTVGKKKTLVQYSIVQRAADWMRSLAVAAHSGHDPAAMHTTHNSSESSWLDEISGSGSSQRTWSCSNAHNTQQFREQLTGWDLWQWQLTADMILQQCTQHTTVQRAADWMRSLVVAAHSGHDPAAMHTTHNNYNSFVSKAISHCILMQILSLYDILSTIC